MGLLRFLMRAIVLCVLIVLSQAVTIPMADTYHLMTDAECLKKMFTRMVFRGYQSIGKVDPYIQKNLELATKAGIVADVYMNPCFFCGKPEVQVAELTDSLKAHKINMIWVSIEGSWSMDAAKNQLFAKGLVAALQAKSIKVGIFTFAPTWARIMGKDFSGLSELPLWYVRWNENPEPDDFIPFGGWTKPAAKQYQAEETECGIDVDYDSFYSSQKIFHQFNTVSSLLIFNICLLYTSPSPRDATLSRMPSSA
eukprot:TRINITY_DN877_c0_g5_i1.p1 TRINITY_DN877_c0_g5~~TRINITY_DN877_c0_g5_i1.p1  ORF type:complete len:253 (+),score=50.35 TRINITY_DN877_c0_g5_i1:2-760(+)